MLRERELLIALVLKLPEDDVGTVHKIVAALINQNQPTEGISREGKNRVPSSDDFEHKGMIHLSKAIAVAVALLTESVHENRIQVKDGFMSQFDQRYRAMLLSNIKYDDLEIIREDALEKEFRALQEMGHS